MRRLRIRSPLIIHETVDGEVVIVNLETGNYYSLAGSGARIWAVLERTATSEEIVTAMRTSFGSEAPAVEASVERLLADLEREGLITPAAAAEAPAFEPLEPVPAGARFAPPVLEKFTDMQELILLDPVHEVDEEKGWPHARPAR